jgi:hypothetical protein
VRSGLDVPTFATRRLHACSHVRAPSGGRWNRGLELSGKFCLNVDFHVTFRDLLHAVKLRHGTDGFTSSQKEGVLRILRYGVTIRGNVTSVYPSLDYALKLIMYVSIIYEFLCPTKFLSR